MADAEETYAEWQERKRREAELLTPGAEPAVAEPPVVAEPPRAAAPPPAIVGMSRPSPTPDVEDAPAGESEGGDDRDEAPSIESGSTAPLPPSRADRADAAREEADRQRGLAGVLQGAETIATGLTGAKPVGLAKPAEEAAVRAEKAPAAEAAARLDDPQSEESKHDAQVIEDLVPSLQGRLVGKVSSTRLRQQSDIYEKAIAAANARALAASKVKDMDSLRRGARPLLERYAPNLVGALDSATTPEEISELRESARMAALGERADLPGFRLVQTLQHSTEQQGRAFAQQRAKDRVDQLQRDTQQVAQSEKLLAPFVKEAPGILASIKAFSKQGFLERLREGWLRTDEGARAMQSLRRVASLMRSPAIENTGVPQKFELEDLDARLGTVGAPNIRGILDLALNNLPAKIEGALKDIAERHGNMKQMLAERDAQIKAAWAEAGEGGGAQAAPPLPTKTDVVEPGGAPATPAAPAETKTVQGKTYRRVPGGWQEVE